MSVISRYLLSLFLKNLGLCLLGFLALYFVVDFIEKFSGFMENATPLGSVLIYFLAQIPTVAALILPVATLASVLITLVVLARNSEIVAFKGSGVSLWKLSAPFIGVGAALSLLVFLMGNTVTPKAAETANRIWDVEVKKRGTTEKEREVKDVWSRDLRLIEHFGTYDESLGEAGEVSILFFDENLRLSSRLEAQRVFFSPEGATFFEAAVKSYRAPSPQGPRGFTFERIPKYFRPGFPSPPPGLGRRSNVNPEEQSVGELAESVKLLEAEGYNPVRQVVDLNFKFSRPFTTLIMIFVGLPIGFWREKGGSIAMGLVPGLLLSFLYLVTLELSRSVGYAGYLPPFIAAWLPNCFFFLLGLYLFSYVRQ
ncbi:MAG: LptF/LptG family permease [Deltaproteobacteria bacterium]|jgi:lipopolysaccharide export system permease protein|nr:LptF/LptG family permease [Deltaproteobacteria bacterium]